MIVVCECEKGCMVPRKEPDECPMHGIVLSTTITVSGSRDGEVMQDQNSSIVLTISDSNHLRRLLGWIACDIGQAPEEMINTFADIAPVIGPDICKEGKERIAESYQKSKNIPKYVRDAIKALRKKL